MPDLDWRSVCLGLAVIGACLLLFCQYMTGELGFDEEQIPDFQFKGHGDE